MKYLVLGIACFVFIDATAGIFIMAIGSYSALRSWRKRTKCDRPKVLNFVDALLRDE